MTLFGQPAKLFLLLDPLHQRVALHVRLELGAGRCPDEFDHRADAFAVPSFVVVSEHGLAEEVLVGHGQTSGPT